VRTQIIMYPQHPFYYFVELD